MALALRRGVEAHADAAQGIHRHGCARCTARFGELPGALFRCERYSEVAHIRARRLHDGGDANAQSRPSASLLTRAALLLAEGLVAAPRERIVEHGLVV